MHKRLLQFHRQEAQQNEELSENLLKRREMFVYQILALVSNARCKVATTETLTL